MIGLTLVAACRHDAPISAAAPSTSAPVQALPTDVLADRIAALTSCSDSCCTQEIPPWVFGHQVELRDPGSLQKARVTIRSSAPARLKALSALRIAVEMQPDDVDLLSPLAAMQDDAGPLPIMTVSQMAQRCYPITWSRPTLGNVALDSLRRLTGASFQTPDELVAWRKARGSLEASFSYWEDSLRHAHGDRHDALAARLESRPELWLRVMLCGDSQAAGTLDLAKAGRVAREILGMQRVARMLQGAETWSECTAPERFPVFAQRVFRMAEAIQDPVLQEAMMGLWSDRKLAGKDRTEAALAVSLSRLRPDQGRRVLADTLDRLTSARAPVLQELSKRYFDVESERLQRFMLAAGIHDSEDRVAILEGALLRGDGAVPMLRNVVMNPSFDSDAEQVIERLVAFVAARDAGASFPRRGEMHVGLYKNSTPEERKGREDQSIAARKDCMARVRAWFGRPRSGPRGT